MNPPDLAELERLASKVRERADYLDAKAESASSASSKVTLLFACTELHKIADMIDETATLRARDGGSHGQG